METILTSCPLRTLPFLHQVFVIKQIISNSEKLPQTARETYSELSEDVHLKEPDYFNHLFVLHIVLHIALSFTYIITSEEWRSSWGSEGLNLGTRDSSLKIIFYSRFYSPNIFEDSRSLSLIHRPVVISRGTAMSLLQRICSKSYK